MNSHRGERIGASRGSSKIANLIYSSNFNINKVKPEYRQNLENYRNRQGLSRRKVIDDERQVVEDTERIIIEEDPRKQRQREEHDKLREIGQLQSYAGPISNWIEGTYWEDDWYRLNKKEKDQAYGELFKIKEMQQKQPYIRKKVMDMYYDRYKDFKIPKKYLKGFLKWLDKK